jgi:hypothetical protein
VRVRVHNTAKDYTTLANKVYRNQFHRPDGTRVRLRGVERAALLHLLSFSWDRADNPEWRLDMDKFVDDFAEGRSTVYAALRQLEVAGFLLRRRENDIEDGGLFAWYWDVTDRPGTLEAEPQARAGGLPPGTKPQVNPRAKNPNVDEESADNSRSPVVDPRSENPHMDSPHMAELDAATSYRETFPPPTYPGTPTFGDAREHKPGGGGNVSDNGRAMAPPPAPARAGVRTRIPAEVGRSPEPAWLEFAAALAHQPAARGGLMPARGDQELLALRCQIAHDERGWTHDQLRQLLLANLQTTQSLAGVWLHRLHPDNLPMVSTPAPAVEAPQRRAHQQDAAVSAARIAEIRAAAGAPRRGPRWTGLMAGAVLGTG